MFSQARVVEFSISPRLIGNADALDASGSTSTPTLTKGMSSSRSVNDENRNVSPSYGANISPRPSSAAIFPPAQSVCWHESRHTLSRSGTVVTPPPSLATFKQLRALAGRKAQPIGCGYIRGVGHNGPGHDGVLANRGVDGSTCIPKRKRGRVSVPEVTRKSCGGLGTKHVDEGDIVVRSAPMVKLSPKRGRHGDRLHRPPDALDARSGRGGIGACEAHIDNLPTHEAADEEHGT